MLLPKKMKIAYKNLYRKGEVDRCLTFSKSRILYMKNNILYELVLKENVENQIYKPKYTYSISDTFVLYLEKKDLQYYDMVCFRINEKNSELYSSYISVSTSLGIIMRDSVQNKIYELLTEHREAKFEISECRNFSNY